MQSSWPLIKRWTDEEHQRFKALAEVGVRAEDIASTLGRSEKAVRARAWQHGITLRLLAPRISGTKASGRHGQ